MRILHTADWHVGKTLARRPRLDEAEAAIKEVVGIAADAKVDLVLVSGDIFEHLVPSPEAEVIVYESLLALEQLRIPVLLIPGNHDSPKRWQAIAPLLQRFSVHVISDVRRPDKGGIVEIPARDGSMAAQIAALPWVGEKRLVSAAELMGLAEASAQIYADELARLIRALCAPLDPARCTIFTGHLFVSGAAIGGGERSLTIGQTYAVTPQSMPDVQYVALGHVHRPQRVPGCAVPARYAGSLLQLDFGEVEQKKSVVLVELWPGRPAEVQEIPITAGKHLIDVSGTLDELEAHRGSEASAFLRVTLKADGYQPGLGDQVRELLPHAIEVRLEYPHAETKAAETLRGIPPREQFARYYEARHGSPPVEAMLGLFSELLDEVSTT
jgi:exonuclease SbcD